MKFGFLKRRHELEKKQIMGRLAAVETLAMLDRNVEQSSDHDTAEAVKRIKKVFGSQLNDDTAEDYLEVLVSHLRKSELNINFKAFNFFEGKTPDKYATKFEVMRNIGGPMFGRNDVEELMFHYSLNNGTGGTNPGWVAAQNRINAHGPMESAEFAGIIRPRYCTVNFASIRDGFGSQWGRSHFKLKDYLKPNMSFTHTDSFGLYKPNGSPQKTQENLATYHNMTRLICNMPDSLFDLLIDSASGRLTKGQTNASLQGQYQYGSTGYIEGHIHAEVLFSRDVNEVRIDQAELQGNPQLKKNLDRFVARHKLNLVMFN